MTQTAVPKPGAAGVLELSILGRHVRTSDAPSAVLEWLRAFWDFPEYHGHAPRSEFVITLDVMDNASHIAEGADVCVAPGWRGGVNIWEMGTSAAGVRLILGAHDARIIAWGVDHRSASSDSEIAAKNEHPRDPHTQLPAALQLALCEALRASGLMPLHASVAARHGEVVALLGPSGMGKSTTLVQAVSAGWVPIAEDFAWLDPATLTVFGWDRGIRLWPAGRAIVGDAIGNQSGDAWHMGEDGKLFLDYAAFGASTARRCGVLTRLALLVRDDAQPSAWEPLPPRDAVRALWEATGVSLALPSRDRTAREIAQLLTRVDIRRLRLGRTRIPL